eukprot:CAMPEP_0113933862 /NCGR_PEP_ID=MMETSP1339-20121228/1185_1 /TAXON_ID=94617 /ORGANISM="Fibrocapsa japonica" /LENGTH=345 /DNA_ID=CAMNT_0000935365 /DNA_START=79 /DNA_END=1113 /DNA_ORIENTATION=- /assembly_acc=CAM_ASM_000762
MARSRRDAGTAFFKLILIAILVMEFTSIVVGKPSKNSELARQARALSFMEFKPLKTLWDFTGDFKTSASEPEAQVLQNAYENDLDVAHGHEQGYTIRRTKIPYSDSTQARLSGLLAWPVQDPLPPAGAPALPPKLPGVLVAHTAVGNGDDFILWKLEAIASLGYAAFALDMYGEEASGAHNEGAWDRAVNAEVRRSLREDRLSQQARARAGYEVFASQPMVDESRIAALGYCYGGMVVLDLAKSGVPLKGVGTMHGILDVPKELDTSLIQCPVQLYHGKADPFVSQEQLVAFQEDMNKNDISWNIHSFPGIGHAFTRPEKLLFEEDVGQNDASEKSWNSFKVFLD